MMGCDSHNLSRSQLASHRLLVAVAVTFQASAAALHTFAAAVNAVRAAQSPSHIVK